MGRLFAIVVLFLHLGCGDEVASLEVDGAPPTIGEDPTHPDANMVCHGATQSGCSEDQKCAIASHEWSCVADGDKDVGVSCTSDVGQGDDCLAGLHCYEGTCHELCTTEDACSDRFELCTAVAEGALGLGICLMTCDPVAQDCATTSAGERQACYLSLAGPVCAPISRQPPLVPGLDCQYLNECAVGAGCVEIDGNRECAAYCDYLNNANGPDPRCAPMAVCHHLQGSETTGVCGE